ncbi:TrkH family potassium uptake protein [Methanoplanus sp. FWC-SCC4]|uniref:TrkH family potassium uptake protein n=1 Tax=Methanochimaera problematica TaxID=2609417 RepID=A0AA97FAI4_9EURY|nr:TrkH family potassium uptake protein [Methanoplanus sp. FWC-SCC4]WOF15577.1 TrkH family potassium uptake protein [Methanoplanus sp. FWC-SCC4]
MNRIAQFSVIADDLGNVLRFISIGTCVPIFIALIYREWDMVLPMALVPVILFLIGTGFLKFPENKREAKLSHALFSVALIWLICAFVGALPFTVGIGMPYLDSVFEAMSGWTDTGLTLLPDVDTTPYTLLFWRSMMQWLGGLGIVAFTVVMLSRTGLNPSRFYRSEGRTEAFMPSVVQQGLQMWKIYLILTFFSVILILLSGVSLWDALNIAMVAIATGGFSVHSAGIPFYENPLLEMLIVPVMIAGALPFKIYYLSYRKKKLSFFNDEQAWLLFFFAILGFIVIALDLFIFTGTDSLTSIRQGIFMAVAGITSTGFQVTSPSTWAPVTVLFLILLMFIGGSSGSTAGGIKLSRAALAYRGILWWFKRTFVSGKVIVPFRFEGKVIPKNVAETEVSKNMLIIILYFLVIFFSAILIMHFETPTHDTSNVLFEIVTATCNNGISTGFVNPDMTPYSKIVFIFAMWIGRLEVMPVIVFFMSILKGFE